MTDIDVVVEPSDGTAGVGVVHSDGVPGSPIAEYQVLQLWPDGSADTVHVGGKQDCMALIEALARVVQEER
jgi:hypothetical protein